MKGKCFSMCNKGQRNKSDFYQTPYSMTEQLLEVEKFEGNILEPACGDYAIVDILKKYISKRKIHCIDIKRGVNFLTSIEGKEVINNIITNPPFSLVIEFIIKAKEIYKRKIAMLLPLSYLHGQRRYKLKIFSELKYIYVFTRYPLLTKEVREDGKYNTGMQVYAWFVWCKNYKGAPNIRWIDNDKYVLRKEKK